MGRPCDAAKAVALPTPDLDPPASSLADGFLLLRLLPHRPAGQPWEAGGSGPGEAARGGTRCGDPAGIWVARLQAEPEPWPGGGANPPPTACPPAT